MSIFSHTERVVTPRSFFKLQQSVRTTYNFGKIYPCHISEMVPGDTFDIYAFTEVNAQPMTAPSKTPIKLEQLFFFVPYRILDENFTDSFSGGETAETFNADYSFPHWHPTTGKHGVGSLWDYFGFPINLNSSGTAGQEVTPYFVSGTDNDIDLCPIDYPRRAYNLIWNEYFRDENVMDKVDIETNEDLLYASWRKDYFTSCLLDQQKGVAPSLGLSGIGPVNFTGGPTTPLANYSLGASTKGLGTYAGPSGPNGPFINGSIDFSDAGTFDVSDLRFVFQVQKWMERNNRCGSRWKEFLLAHFGEDIGDNTLQRPEYIGGQRQNIVVSQVLQTSQTATTPQGYRVGSANSQVQGHVGKWHAKENGILIGLVVIRPQGEYSQGVNRQWIKNSRFDFYSPEFAHLSEQEVYEAELYCEGTAEVPSTDTIGDNSIFGFQGRFNELRYLPNLTTGLMRTKLRYWHQSRIFSAYPTYGPTFLKCIPDNRIFTSTSEDPFIVEMAFVIKAFRPLPAIPTPGLVDHF